jgi:hypothetical protein
MDVDHGRSRQTAAHFDLLFMVVFGAAVFIGAPSRAFAENTTISRSEQAMQATNGWAGKAVSRIMAVQKLVYAHTGLLARSMAANTEAVP